MMQPSMSEGGKGEGTRFREANIQRRKIGEYEIRRLLQTSQDGGGGETRV